MKTLKFLNILVSSNCFKLTLSVQIYDKKKGNNDFFSQKILSGKEGLYIFENSVFKGTTDILSFQREFFQSARREARAEQRYGYVFGSDGDASRARHLIDMLLVHQVEIYPLAADIREDGQSFTANDAYVVPLNQDQYRFVKAVFDPILEFEDSLFYDISTWTYRWPATCRSLSWVLRRAWANN